MARFFFAVLGLPIAVMVLCFCTFMAVLHVGSEATQVPPGFARWVTFTLASVGVIAFAVRTWWRKRADPQADQFTVKLVPALLGIGLLAGGGFVAAAHRRLELQRVAEVDLFCGQQASVLGVTREACATKAMPCVARLGLGEPPGDPLRMSSIARCLK
jgi:uncharacterized membrane protein